MSKRPNQKVFVTKVLFILAVVLCATPYISAPIALVGGFLFTHFLGHPFAHLNHKATGLLLKVSVVGLGFGMNVHSAMHVGREGLGLTIASIAILLTLGFVIGRWLHMPRKASHLVASGTAICGGSAIAAVAPAVNASEKEISVSLGVIFLLNSVALIVFPMVGHMLGLTQHQFGMWSAIAIHDTSSVVSAASAYGGEALEVATTVKLARALWIIPVSLLSAFLFKSKGKKIAIPWFIGFFILAMLANSYLPFVGTFGPGVVTVSKAALVVTLFLIGAGLSVEKIKSVGWKPLLLGVLLWAVISVLSLGAILYA
ncbi:MAG: putative sulfate exporter family transporter [Rikenellaceae bacterium]|nr:putative sulfate exporter family transporter [Rikenellaceae bacterium]